ncbi:hypothetical protein BH23CHL2_BH23CHL2_21970 [soil metagenome]
MRALPVQSILFFARRLVLRYSPQIWIVTLTLFAALFLIQGRHDLARAFDALGSSSPLWISVIVAVQVGGLVISAISYQVLLRHTGHRLCLRRLVAIHLERKVIGTVVPAGGPASVYVFVRATGRDGVSSQDALLTVGVRSLLGYTSFISVLVPSLMLARPDGVLLLGAFTLIGGFILLTGLLLLLLRHQQTLDRIALRLPERLKAMLQHTRNHRTRPRDLLAPYLLALLGQFASVLTLTAALYALGYAPSVVSILAAYAVGTAAVTLAPAFQGIGVVEVSIAVTLQQFGVPADVAIGATLLYRGATVWLPLFLGAISHAGQRLPLPATPEWRTRPELATLLSDGFLRKAVATPLALAVMMVMLSGSDSTHPTHPAVELREHESRIHLTAY